MKTKIFSTTLALIFLVLIINFVSVVSALVVDANYITIYPGEEGKITLKVENNENFDIEDVSISLNLNELPFSSVGSSEKDIDEIDEDDSDKVTFTLRATTDISPGDYNIPYKIDYVEKDENETITKTGTFGIRVSAKTEIDFAVEVKGETTNSAIVGQKGKVSLEIINKGLGDLRSVSVEIFPQGFELISKNRIFVGTVSAEDSDVVSFDVIFKSKNPSLSAKVTYKDFENNDEIKAVDLPFNVYTKEEALELGLINKNYSFIYASIVIVLIAAWFVYRSIRKRRRNKKKRG